MIEGAADEGVPHRHAKRQQVKQGKSGQAGGSRRPDLPCLAFCIFHCLFSQHHIRLLLHGGGEGFRRDLPPVIRRKQINLLPE